MAILGVFAFILGMLLPVGIIALIVAAAVNKEKGNDASKFTIGVKTVYTYIIVIATLFMIISGTIISVPSLLDYFLPESELEVQSDSYYTDSEEEKALIVRNERHRGLINFASALAVVVIATPIFISHSKVAKKLRTEKEESKVNAVKAEKTTQTKKVAKVKKEK